MRKLTIEDRRFYLMEVEANGLLEMVHELLGYQKDEGTFRHAYGNEYEMADRSCAGGLLNALTEALDSGDSVAQEPLEIWLSRDDAASAFYTIDNRYFTDDYPSLEHLCSTLPTLTALNQLGVHAGRIEVQ